MDIRIECYQRFINALYSGDYVTVTNMSQRDFKADVSDVDGKLTLDQYLVMIARLRSAFPRLSRNSIIVTESGIVKDCLVFKYVITAAFTGVAIDSDGSCKVGDGSWRTFIITDFVTFGEYYKVARIRTVSTVTSVMKNLLD